jgi:hypothetical protein
LHISKTFIELRKGPWVMKTVSRRIRKDQDERLVALGKNQLGGGNINGMLQEALDRWLELVELAEQYPGLRVKRLIDDATFLWKETEGPVWKSVVEETNAKLASK